MEIGINFASINWLAVMVATLAGFMLGGAWYSPLLCGRFLPGLMENLETRTGQSRNIPAIFSLSFAMLWLAASFLAGLLGAEAGPREGFDVGLAIGLFFVFPAHTIAAIFGARPTRIVFINGAYFMALFAAMGAILGAWH